MMITDGKPNTICPNEVELLITGRGTDVSINDDGSAVVEPSYL